MRYVRHILVLSLFLIINFCFARCQKDRQIITLPLHDKSLPIIQSYIKGKWKLQYVYGGLIERKYADKDHSYMILTPYHIIIGNASTGVVVDTTIVWERAKARYDDSTYLLTYSWSGYLWPEHYLVDQIKNDTLIIIDDVDDGFSYYYTKY